MLYSLVFLGRPPLATSLICSTQDGSYTAVGPEYPIGLIPFLERRILAVLGFMPSISPISLTFNPFTSLLSAAYKKYKEFVVNVQQIIDLICGDSVTYIKGIKTMTINIKGYDVLIDDEDADRILSKKWHLKKVIPGKGVYFASYIGKKDIAFHRFILDAPAGKCVDHISGDTLDNRKVNLRVCTLRENTMNSTISNKNKTGYKGVLFDKKLQKFYACLGEGKQRHRSRHFHTAEEAHLEYERMAKEKYGEFYRPSDYVKELDVGFTAKNKNEYIVKRGQKNKHGYAGVSFNKFAGKYHSRISVNNKHYYLGTFNTPEEAHKAYCDAVEKFLEKEFVDGKIGGKQNRRVVD
ncbi:MAG: HNH endonuclease [Treponema sp.]|jgi:hypothetical protein|nr:HNH endonuclease [Treponema sp.]